MHPQVLSWERMNRDSMAYASTFEFVQSCFTNLINGRRLKTQFSLRESYNLHIKKLLESWKEKLWIEITKRSA
jgi:hypothetical protein